MSNKEQTYLFNPSHKEPEILKAEFVVHVPIFEQIFADIQKDNMQKPPQHYMILGQRGMGKTTMLLKLKYAVLDDVKLKKWLLPILFNEEQYAMPDLASYFEHIAKILSEEYPVYSTLLDTMRVHEYEDEYEQKAYEILVEKLKENKQKIIVFHDNFGQFLEKIGEISTHFLEYILSNTSEIRLVGTSTTLMEHTLEYSKTFFNLFCRIRLNGMTADETIMLFKKLAKNVGKSKILIESLKTEYSRIEVIRRLSGGVIRTMVMLFDVFTDSEKQDSFKDLELILDRLTPLYKSQIDNLKPQQQLILDAIAREWDGVNVSKIGELIHANRQGLKTNQISAQLKQLSDNQIISIERNTDGRGNLYRLQERFFNIWYLLRYCTRQDKQRIIWYVKFLEGWCDTNDLKQLFDRYDNNLENEVYELNTVFDRALAYSMVENNFVLEEKFDTLIKAINYLEKSNFDESSLKLLYEQLNDVKKIQVKRMDFFADIDYIFQKTNTVLKEYLKKIKRQEVDSKMNLKYGKLKQFEEEKADFLLYVHNQYFFHIMLDIIMNDDISFDKKTFHQIIPNISLTFQNIFFTILLAKKQYHTAYKLFEESPKEVNLKDRLKPIYFLTMEYLKDEYPNEYLKAGEEYRETIEELKVRVKWFEENLG